MEPRDLASLLEYLRQTRDIDQLNASLLTQWGPANQRFLSPDYLPPRRVTKNQDTLEDVRFRTVAAVDGGRHDPAQLVDGGELWGKVHYELGNSDLLRELAGPDFEAINRYLGSNRGMLAAARLVGLYNTMIIQAMAAHDELMNWDAIVFNNQTRRGDNGYYEYVDGPTLTGARVAASVDWTDADNDPWVSDIIPRIRYLTNLGYTREGIRVVTTTAALETLADHPATAQRIVVAPLATGQSVEQAVGYVTESDVERIFRTKLGIRSVQTHDQRIMTKTGSKRYYPAGHMTFIASTGRDEEVIYDEDDPSDVRVVRDVLGFTGIGVANTQTTPGRRGVVRAFTNQKDSRVEFEGWQSTGPVILDPTAISDIYDITTGVVS